LALKVFWSWQSDLETASHKTLIQKAINAAIDQIALELDVDPAERPEIDHDTKGTAGAGEIAKIIFDKIDSCAAFIADVTPVGKSDAGKWLPNPNVMVETGWALKSRTHERVILILNLASGCKIEDLPFDLRSRRCMTYTCAIGLSSAKREKIRAGLAEALVDALKTNLAAGSSAAPIDLTGALAASEPDGSIWTGSANELALLPTQGHPAQSFRVAARPRAYLRIAPAGWEHAAPTLTKYAALPLDKRPQAGPGGASHGDFGAQSNGYVDVWFGGGPENRDVATATKYHSKTGEIWTVWSAPQHGDGRQLALQPILQLWRTSLRTPTAFLDANSAKKLRYVEAELAGADGFVTPGQFSDERRTYRDGAVRHSVTRSDWSEAAQLQFLADAFNEVLDLVMYDSISPAGVNKFLQG
jgi:hypothetical protein